MLTNSDILEHTKKERNELPIAAKLLGKKNIQKNIITNRTQYKSTISQSITLVCQWLVENLPAGVAVHRVCMRWSATL